jgi:hypothetical protein
MRPIEFENEHLAVLNRAHRIYVNKSQLRGQMWRDFPPSDKLRELRERVSRLEAGYQQIRFDDPVEPPAAEVVVKEALIEDALDLINYAAFFIKQLERGQRG